MKVLVLVLDDGVDLNPLVSAIPNGSVLCGIEDSDPNRAAESLKAFAAATNSTVAVQSGQPAIQE